MINTLNIKVQLYYYVINDGASKKRIMRTLPDRQPIAIVDPDIVEHEPSWKGRYSGGSQSTFATMPGNPRQIRI